MKFVHISGMVLIAAALNLFSQCRMPGDGDGSQGNGEYYGPETVETVVGTIVSVDVAVSNSDTTGYVIVRVSTDREDSLPIIIGPKWYIDNLNFTINTGDSVEITGTRVRMDQYDAMIGSEIRKGDISLMLRDSDGVPLWTETNRQGS